jgi:hypothetical protein
VTAPDAPHIKLEARGVETASPTDEDLFRALDGPRGDDWCVTLWRDDDDFIEAMLDQGAIWVESEVGGRFLQARSHVDEAALRSMFVAFRDGAETWRDLAEWKEPPPRAAAGDKPSPILMGASAFVGAVVLLGVGTALVTGNGGWVVLTFALLFPALVALAASVKAAEAQRMAKWTRGSAKVVRSELATQTRNQKEVEVPLVEYEFGVGFHRYRGRRVSLAELIAGPDAKGTVARYPVGASVPVYYDPADPNRSVLDRELPGFFRGLWAAVAVLTAGILAGGWYFLLR